MKRDWTPELIAHFIELYGDEPDLWCNSNASDVETVIANHNAWAKVQRSVISRIPRSELKRKWESLLSIYYEIREIAEKRGPVTSVKINWPYYEKMDKVVKKMNAVRIAREAMQAVQAIKQEVNDINLDLEHISSTKEIQETTEYEPAITYDEETNVNANKTNTKSPKKQNKSTNKTNKKQVKRKSSIEDKEEPNCKKNKSLSNSSRDTNSPTSSISHNDNKDGDTKDDCTKPYVDDDLINIRETAQDSNSDVCLLYATLLCKKLRCLKENTQQIAMLEIDRIIFHLRQQEQRMEYMEQYRKMNPHNIEPSMPQSMPKQEVVNPPMPNQSMTQPPESPHIPNQPGSGPEMPVIQKVFSLPPECLEQIPFGHPQSFLFIPSAGPATQPPT